MQFFPSSAVALFCSSWERQFCIKEVNDREKYTVEHGSARLNPRMVPLFADGVNGVEDP